MSKQGRERDRELERRWRQRMKRWHSSGRSVREFCEAESVPQSAFYFWRRTLTERADEREVPRAGTRPQFVPVRVTHVSSAIEVMTTTGRVVRVQAGFDAALLRSVLAAVEASC